MYLNLEDLTPDETNVTADVCIVGAGAAGLYLAGRLAKLGAGVVVLEAGDLAPRTAADAGFVALQQGDFYSGAVTGRFFGVGGSTSNWGGVLVPHCLADLTFAPAHDKFRASWRAILESIDKQQNAVLSRLGCPLMSGDLTGWGITADQNQKNYLILDSLHMPFKKKNFRFLVEDEAPSYDIIYNATVCSTKIREHQSGVKLRKIFARSSTGVELSVDARKVIICCGGIESPRILLELADNHQELEFLKIKIGQLSDHLSVEIAEIEPKARSKIALEFGPRFRKGWMLSKRIINTDNECAQVRSFAHFVFENPGRGFSVAKEVLAALQARRMPSIRFSDLVLGTADLILLAVNRYIFSRLYINTKNKVKLQLDIEQETGGKLSLSDEVDALGRKKLSIDWSVSQSDLRKFDAVAKEYTSILSGDFDFELNREALRPNLGDKPYGAYHPVGACPMGEDDSDPLDLNCKVRGVDNLWVVSTAALPSAGSANPTFTMLCIAENLICSGALIEGSDTTQQPS